jgi:PilZ domain-containing protein
MIERRVENRFLCADLVRVDRLVGEDEFETLEAVLEDISPLGACIQTETEVPLGSTLTISIGEQMFAGYVCYCSFREIGYFVGLRFSDETRWSTEIVEPQHLTSLQALVLKPEVPEALLENE